MYGYDWYEREKPQPPSSTGPSWQSEQSVFVMYLQTLPPLSWSHAVSWRVCAEAFKKGCMVWLSKNCSLITLHIAVFLKALVEQRHFHYIHRARKWNPTWNLRGRAYVCLTITNTHTKKPYSKCNVILLAHIHPSLPCSSLSFSPSILEGSTDPSLRLAAFHFQLFSWEQEPAGSEALWKRSQWFNKDIKSRGTNETD